jgi:iron(III) transport system permease protein
VYLPVAARLGALPSSLEESARLLGQRPWTVFRTVALPQTSSAIAAGALLVFLYTISDFGAVQVLRYETLTRSIYANRAVPTTWVALSLLLGLVALLVTFAELELARRRPGPASAATGARAGLSVPLGRWRWPALIAVAALALAALAGPVAALTHWAVRGDSGIGVSGGDLLEPTLNTALAGVSAALVAVAVVLPVAYLMVRHRSPVGGLASTLVVAGFALPGLVIALALTRLTVAYPALYQGYGVLILAYVVHFGAQSMRTSQVAVATVPHRLGDAARMLGAGPLRRFVTIDLPLMLPVLAAGAGLVLLSTMKELPVTLLLAPLGFETLATRVWYAVEEGFLAEAGATSLLLLAVSGVLTWFLVIRRAQAFR